MTPFDRAFALVVGEEGGYVNDPDDPGGETKYGISKEAHPDVDIAALTLEQAKTIYLDEYWNPLKLNDYTPGFALVLFDCAVNQGLGFCHELLTSAEATQSPRIVNFQAERALHYAGLSDFERYGRGWMRRLIQMAVSAGVPNV